MKTINHLIIASAFGVVGLFYGTLEFMFGMGGKVFKISILDIVWHLSKYLNLNINTLASVLISYFIVFFILGLFIVWIYGKIKNKKVDKLI